tara:strand:- start:3213 stop:3554 length:342 start_codon:yes stop_codon:yes gene_type:complete
MKNKSFSQFSLLLMLILLISSCSNSEIDSDLEFRIDILYAHTIQMEDYSTAEQLVIIGLDISFLDSETANTSLIKLQQLEASFGVISKGTYEERLLLLEEMMNQMMEEWALLQ